MTQAEVTLKEFMELRFDGLDEKVGERFDDLDGKVIDLDTRVKALEDCISNDVKHIIRAWRNIAKAIVGILVAIVVALAIAGLRQWFGF